MCTIQRNPNNFLKLRCFGSCLFLLLLLLEGGDTGVKGRSELLRNVFQNRESGLPLVSSLKLATQSEGEVKGNSKLLRNFVQNGESGLP